MALSGIHCDNAEEQQGICTSASMRPVPAPAIPHCPCPTGKSALSASGRGVGLEEGRPNPLSSVLGGNPWLALPVEEKASMPEPKPKARAQPSAANVGKEQGLVSLSPGVSPSWHRHTCCIAGSCLWTWNSERRKTGCRPEKEKSSSGSDSVSVLKSQEKISYKYSFLQSGLLSTWNTKSEPYIFSKTKNQLSSSAIKLNRILFSVSK